MKIRREGCADIRYGSFENNKIKNNIMLARIFHRVSAARASQAGVATRRAQWWRRRHI